MSATQAYSGHAGYCPGLGSPERWRDGAFASEEDRRGGPGSKQSPRAARGSAASLPSGIVGGDIPPGYRDPGLSGGPEKLASRRASKEGEPRDGRGDGQEHGFVAGTRLRRPQRRVRGGRGEGR